VTLRQYLVALCGDSARQRLARRRSYRDVDRHSTEARIRHRPSSDATRWCIKTGSSSEPDHLCGTRPAATTRRRLWSGCPDRRRRPHWRIPLCLPGQLLVLPCRESDPDGDCECKRGNPPSHETPPAARSYGAPLPVGACGSAAAAGCASGRRRHRAIVGRASAPRKQLAPSLARLLAVPVAIFEGHTLNLNSCR
jgi:hypothetical protein